LSSSSEEIDDFSSEESGEEIQVYPTN
jgi:transposase